MYIIKRTKDKAIEYYYEIPYDWTCNRAKAKTMNLMRAESKFKILRSIDPNWIYKIENALELIK